LIIVIFIIDQMMNFDMKLVENPLAATQTDLHCCFANPERGSRLFRLLRHLIHKKAGLGRLFLSLSAEHLVSLDNTVSIAMKRAITQRMFGDS
jgi:hypothetical protein